MLSGGAATGLAVKNDYAGPAPEKSGKATGLEPLNARLDGLLSAAAKLHETQTYLTDPPHKMAVCGAEPRSYSFGDANTYITRVAALLAMVGVKQDDTVLLRLPNTVEASLFAFGCWRAGARVCAIPLTFRFAEWRDALQHIAPKALITCERIGEESDLSTAYSLAEDLFSIRFVGALYGSASDGIMDVDLMLDELGPELPEPATGIDDATAVASLHLSETPHGMAIIPHTHGSLAANAAVLNSVLKLHAGNSILQAFLPSGLTGLAGGPVVSLLAGSTCHLHHPFDADSFQNQLSTVTVALAPAPIVNALSDAQASRCVSVWPYAQKQTNAGTKSKRHIASLGDIAFAPMALDEDGRVGLPLGSIGPDGNGRYGTLRTVDSKAASSLGSAASRVVRSDTQHQVEVSGAVAPDLAAMNALNVGGNSFFTGSEKNDVLLPVTVSPPKSAHGIANVEGLADGFHLIGNMPVVLGDVETSLVMQPGIAAAGFSEANAGLGVAVVPEGATEIDASIITALIDEFRLGTHKKPAAVVNVTALPKTNRGKIDREKLSVQIDAALADLG